MRLARHSGGVEKHYICFTFGEHAHDARTVLCWHAHTQTRSIMRRKVIAIFAFAVALTAAPAFAAGTAQDRKPLRQRAEWRPGPLVRGQVAAINGVVITVKIPGKRTPDVAVTTTSATRYFATGVSAPTIGNIQKGDRIVVLADRTPSRAASTGAPASITAAAITVLPQPDSAVVGGDVKSVTAGKLSMVNKRGVASDVDLGNAKIVITGKATASAADLIVGVPVIVLADRNGDALTARIVVARPSSSDNVLAGMVASVDGNTLTVMSRKGALVTVDAANAAVWLRSDAEAMLADVRVGRAIVVVGTPGEGGRFTAQVLGQFSLPK
jgi:hypothetical protein